MNRTIWSLTRVESEGESEETLIEVVVVVVVVDSLCFDDVLETLRTGGFHG